MDIIFHPIGVVRNDYIEKADPKTLRNSQSILILDEKYIPALEGLKQFKHIIVAYNFNKIHGYLEKVHPMGDKSLPKRGVFATRSPCRPNPIGITLVEIIEIKGQKIIVTGLDSLNDTPILDIKPYEEHFDSPLGLQMEKDPLYCPTE